MKSERQPFMKRFILLIKRIVNKLSKDNIGSYSAQSCFYITLSLVPFLLLLMSLMKYLPISPDNIITIMQSVIPKQIMPVISDIIYDIYNNSSIAIISLTTLIAIWSAGRGFTSIMKGLNTIYGTSRGSNWFISRILSSLYTVIFLFSIIASLILLVFGEKIVSIITLFLPALGRILSLIINNSNLLFPTALALIFLIMYKFIPNRKTTILNELPGAVLASAGWILYSFFYSLYVNYSSNFSTMYGSLATLVFAMIWLYFCMNIIFWGAEINSFIAEWRSKNSRSRKEEI